MKKLLAILLAAMLAASMLVVPASAVEGIPDSAYQPYVEAVQEKFKAGNISGSISYVKKEKEHFLLISIFKK